MLYISQKVANTKPLLYMKNGLIVSRGTALYWADLQLKKFSKIVCLPTTRRQKYLSKNRLIVRIMRLDIGPAIQLGETDEILVWAHGKVYRVNTSLNTFEIETIHQQGRAPLSMAYNSNAEIGPIGTYFGEYFSNNSMGSVWIWRRDEYGKWSRVFEFTAGQINHIHAIVTDEFKLGFIVLTGDYGDAPCIWFVDHQLRNPVRLTSADQKSRACWILPEKDKLIYATDTHLEPNSVRCIIRGNENPNQLSQELGRTIGSSIYKLSTAPGSIFFSTAVEPGEPKKSKIRNLLTRTPGPGILGPKCGIYYGSSSSGFDLVFEKSVDGLPLRLFGFGAFVFPSGISSSATQIHCYASGIEGLDGHTLLLEKNCQSV